MWGMRLMRSGRRMICTTGNCPGAQKSNSTVPERKIDPLWHIVLHESGDRSSIEVHPPRRLALLRAAEEIRQETFWHVRGSRGRPAPWIRDWLESTEVTIEWIKSSRAFRAPAEWPEDVEAAWGHAVPEPWEVANAIPECCYRQASTPFWYGHDISTLVSYACGMSVFELSKIVGVAESHIIHHMASGARNLLKNASFDLWRRHIDVGALAALGESSRGLISKIRLYARICHNPLEVKARDVESFLGSALSSGAPLGALARGRPGRRPVHRRAMICEPR